MWTLVCKIQLIGPTNLKVSEEQITEVKQKPYI